MYYCSYIDIVNNNVFLNPTEQYNSKALHVNYCEQINLKNNILNNAGGGVAVYIEGSVIESSDNNNFYSPGENLGYWENYFNSLPDLQLLTGMDLSSVSSNPYYFANNDLHVSDAGLNGKGSPHSRVTDDIDGEIRDLNFPDIGADEFTPPANDAGVRSIDNPKKPFVSGTESVSVTIKNFGTNPLTSAIINWSVNGVSQPHVNWTGNIASGETEPVSLGNFTFERNEIYNITSWTSMPNGITDNLRHNDTIKSSALIASLSGVYTIGGIDPDFTGFQLAINAMTELGLVGPVTFKIRSGTYNEQIYLAPEIGSSEQAEVIFESESGDSTSVILEYSNTYQYNNYIILFYGADYVTFNKITIKALNSYYGRLIDFRNYSDHNTIKNCVIKGISAYGSSEYLANIYSEGSRNEFNSFTNNHLINGSYGFLYSGTGILHARGTRIENNIFENQSNYGMRIIYQDSIIIQNNIINSLSDYSEFYGISVRGCINQIQINKNKIHIPHGGIGIDLNYSNRTSNDRGLISNNFISVGGGGYGRGIQISYAEYLRIYNNNIHILNTANSGSRALDISGEIAGSLDVKNNILANSAGGYSYFVSTPAIINSSDNNDLFTTGEFIGYWSTNISNLDQLKTNSGKDLLSVSVDPHFVSPTDLHVLDAGINGKGSPLMEIIQDIDGQDRNLTHPDIGADEFNPFPLDAGMFAIEEPRMPFSSGNRQVVVIIKNFGGDTLKSLALDWRINDVLQTRYNWTGSLVSGDTVRINIGNYTFNIQDKYAIECWTTLPNGQADLTNENDTILSNDLYAGLNGSYTIGGTTPAFQNFTDAINTLNTGGIIGPVTFKIRPGTYSEQISIPAISGSGINSSITFEPESGDSTSVVLTYSSNSSKNYTLQLLGAKYLIFNKLTILAENISYGNVIDISNQSHSNTISNSIIRSASINSIIINSTDIYGNDYIRIINNKIINGSYGIYAGNRSKYISIINNTLENQNSAGIYVNYQDTLIIQKNTITTNSGSASYSAIHCNSTTRKLIIEKNRISLANGGHGIQLNSCNCPTQFPGIISNNFINIGGTGYSTGINIYSSRNQNISHNSINITSTNANGRAFNISDNYTYALNVDLRNNILCNTGGGFALYTSLENYLRISDYNDLFTTGPNLAFWKTNKANLSELRLANNQDLHSISINPQFLSHTDLHVQETSLNNAGTPIPAITDDIDGEDRDLHFPDIGADEFLNATHDIGIMSVMPATACLLSDNETVTVSVRNIGAFPESGFNISYILDNNEPVTESISQVIPVGGSLEYSFSKKANLSGLKNYRLKAYAALPGDKFPVNDTISVLISNMPKLEIKLTNDTLICAGAFVTLKASGADSYLWSTGHTTASITIIPSNTTTYTVTAKNRYNCEDADTVTVQINPYPPVPVISASGPLTFCNDSFVVLTSSIAENLTWSTLEKTPSIVAKSSGFYFVKYTDLIGCTSLSSYVQVTRELPPTISPADTTVCLSEPIPLKVTNATAYVWSTGAVTQNITVNPVVTTTYNVRATTALGCEADLTSTVNVRPSKTPSQVGMMIPADGTNELSLPLGLSWMPSDNASNYDLFIWPSDEPKPQDAFASNITVIRTDFEHSFPEYGTTYNWQVISKYFGCESTPGPVQTFSMRHLPDLVITNVQIPQNAFTGQEIEVTWEVKNEGLGNTANRTWSDHLSMSLDSISPDDFHSLGNVSNQTYLEPGQSYSKKASFRLPQYKDGIFSIFSFADRNNQILETNDDNNYGVSDSPIIVKLAPTPDLFVSEVITPSDFFSEDTIQISWRVKNDGIWRTETGNWYDRVYFSSDYNLSKRHFLGDFLHSGDTLRPGESYLTTNRVVIPEGVFGRYYFYIETDINNNVQEHAFDGNNLTQSDSTNVILRPPADLVVSEISIPKNATNIETVNISWNVTNIGNSSPTDFNWMDVVYLSKSPTFKPGNLYHFPFYRSAAGGIPLNLEYFNTEIIKIPNDIEPGDYYVYVKTDNGNQVFEYIFKDNNLLRSDTTIRISIAPWPDLIVSEISQPDSAGSGSTIPFRYKVRNKGIASAKAGWTDRIYISGVEMNTFLKEIKRYDKLDPDSTYSIVTNLVLPSGFYQGSGTYKLFVSTDTSRSVYEHINEKNNQLSSEIFITPSDLLVSASSVVPTILSGTTTNIGWTVNNAGINNTPAKEWYDKVELVDSLSNSLTRGDMNIYGKYGPLKAGESYSLQTQLIIPEGISGNYFVKISTDFLNNNKERSTDNNTVLIPVTISLRQPSDLIISSFSLPETGTAGQPVSFSWVVKNAGTGITFAPQWNDCLFLSKDTIIDQNDAKLGYFSRMGELHPNGTYNKLEQIFLPISTIGNYYVIVQTDYLSFEKPYGMEFEFNAETNNYKYSLLTINLAPPSDLVVTNISAPANAIAGEPITIGWTIKNLGPNNAKGFLSDMVYLSTDTNWDITDPLFGEKPVQIDLDPNEEVTFSMTADVTGTSVGTYHVLVRTDNKNNINEVNNFNNTLSSTSTIKVEVPLLTINETVERTIPNNKGIYFRIEVPDSLVDETLLVSLQGDTIAGNNELFISFDRVPDRSDFDFNSRIPFYGNQELIVPSLQKGTYYLLVYGTLTAGTLQDISVLASIINFQVRKLDANKGGNKGKVTTEMYGAKFTSDLAVILRNPMHVIERDTLIFVDPTKAFVSFNLAGAPLGFYDVIAINSKGDSTVFVNGFEVVESSPFGLVTSVKAPGRVRINTSTTISIQYANDGNIDIPVPGFKLISEDKLPIAFTRKDLEKGQTELEFELRELNGPQHILRPGAVNTLYIWVNAGSETLTARFRFE